MPWAKFRCDNYAESEAADKMGRKPVAVGGTLREALDNLKWAAQPFHFQHKGFMSVFIIIE